MGNNGFHYNDKPGTRGTLNNLNYYVFVLSIMICSFVTATTDSSIICMYSYGYVR